MGAALKCLLVKPPVQLAVARSFYAFLHLEPLDLAIVAGGVEEPHQARILDLSLYRSPQRAFDRALTEFRPDLVGFGCYSNQAAAVKQFAGRLRQRSPRTVVVVGGVHATTVPSDMALTGVVDFVVRGEGGVALREILRALSVGAVPASSERILAVQDPRFAEWAARLPPEPPPFSAVPRPRRDLVQTGRYFCVWSGDQGQRMQTVFPCVATVRTSMGCPFRCSFCVVHHLARGRYFERDPEEVVEEIAALPQQHVYFVDDEMFINPRRTARIAELLIERGIRKEYISWARSDTICRHPELFRLWKKAGMRVLYVGLESMEESILARYQKGCAAEVNRRAVAILRELDIGLHAAFMVNPEFDADDFVRLRRNAESVLPAEVSFTVFSPPPGTKLWEETKDRFICPDPYRFYDCMHTLMPTRLPLKQFYRHFSLLYFHTFRRNPWRTKNIRAPYRDILRVLVSGFFCGLALRSIHKDYARKLW